jgi:hypothetical protein
MAYFTTKTLYENQTPPSKNSSWDSNQEPLQPQAYQKQIDARYSDKPPTSTY